MNNIASYKNVNYIDSKSEWLSVFFAFVFKWVGERPFFKKDEVSGKVYAGFENESYSHAITNPTSFFFLNAPPISVKRDVNKTFKKLEYVRETLKERNLTDEELKTQLKIIYSTIPILQTSKINGEIRHFEGNAKGTKRYNTKQKGKIMDFVKNHDPNHWECFFITITCAANDYGNRRNAWLFFNEFDGQKAMLNLRKHYGCEFVGVVESTKKGYPHIHYIAFFPKGFMKNYDKMENGHAIRQGFLYDTITKNMSSKVKNIQVAKGENLKYYLTKYISKGTTEDIFSLANKKGSFTKEERSTVMQLVYTKAFKKRTVLMCKDRSLAAIKQREEEKKASVSAQHLKAKLNYKVEQSLRRLKLKAREARRFLTSLCNNCPYYISPIVKSLSVFEYKRRFNHLPERNIAVSDEDKNKFDKKAFTLSDDSGFFRDFCDFVLGNYENQINTKFYDEESSLIYTRKADGFDLNNDDDFMQVITSMVDYYFYGIFCKNKSYAELIRGEENDNFIDIVRHRNYNKLIQLLRSK